MSIALSTVLTQADSLRFKLLAIIGKNEEKKKKIINSLVEDNWHLVDVESELLPLQKDLDEATSGLEFEIGSRIKDWFNSKPNKLILTNASILYHDIFLKISPVGAFKYNSRNKNCVLFLEDEQKLGSRIYYGQAGKEDYYDQEINDIVLVKIDDIAEDYTIKPARTLIAAESELKPQAIGQLFNFKQIKDVVDIDSDIKGTNRQREIVSSFIISESLERQIAEFFEDMKKPRHKARTVIGNYGSGKSHLIGFLASLVENPELVNSITNEKIKQIVMGFDRKYLTVHFELQSGQVELKRWFYGKVKQQLKTKYALDIPVFDSQQDYDNKENINRIMELVKTSQPTAGLLVIIDEISDFLATKQREAMKEDLQFLRVIGQVCQDQDMMFVASMQEDVFSSPKFKDVASELGRIGERFQNIIIHREDIKRVISERIVPKNSRQKHELEGKFIPFAEKIEDVSRNLDDYVDLFPLTPFLIKLFSDLPYFEKRGVIQFAIDQIKCLLNEEFPYFITFDKIYDQLENNPNKRNLEEIHNVSQVMHILTQKISLLESKYQSDAHKIVKGLAVYSLWNKQECGATAQELANNLMLLPHNKTFTAADNIDLIIKKIREVTDGEYIKTQKDENSGLQYFRFDTKSGVDMEQKIAQKAGPVSDDEIEHELFEQLKDILELERVEGQTNVFTDECEWRSAKSFRQGYIVFVKKGAKFSPLPPRDYAIVFVSPFVESFAQTFAKNQLTIKLHLEGAKNTELLKEIVAIKSLIDSKFQKHIMTKKLEERINGYDRGTTTVTGFKYRLSKLLIHSAICDLNGNPESIRKVLGREKATIPEIIEGMKTSLFDKPFNDNYPLHPVYSIQLSSRNIVQSLNPVASDLTRGDFNNLVRASRLFLQSMDLLDSRGYPDLSQSRIAQKILEILKIKKQQVTDIEKDIVTPLQNSDYGLESEIVYLCLVLMTVLGKVYLQLKGGERIDINNIKEKLKSLAAFETIAYTRLQEDYSYDFASRLLNALGLVGEKIAIEKERQIAFKEYKERIYSILQSIQTMEDTIRQLKQKETIYIDMEAVQKEFTNIQAINWQALDIANHMQFGKIESVSDKLDKIVIALNTIDNLNEALKEYSDGIHEAIDYMIDAMKLLENCSLLVTDKQKQKALKEFRDNVITICADYNKFSDRSQRNPINGKIQQFKKSYIYDFYLPAHEKYVGKKVSWDILNTYSQNETFQKVSMLSHLTCINDVTFNQKVLAWNELKQYQCIRHNMEESLKSTIRCQHQQCLFPSKVNYSEIPGTLGRIENEIEAIYSSYEKNVIKEVRNYRDNMQYLDNATEKQLIQSIMDNQKLPAHITQQTVQTINKLFKEIEVVEIEQDKIIEKLFPDEEMTTIEELRKRYFALEEDLKKNHQENEIRIKLK
ncbi:MAG: BREX-3 system P-loop-containing protein BrxF [bacterium]|nr:BREX-3 system P-loop-containing protein BrxF [bacterium]